MSKSDDLLLFAFQTPRTDRTGTDIHHSEALRSRAHELGIPDHHKEFYWIAEESLKAALPENWIQCHTDEGYIYYWNAANEDSVWDHPGLEYYKNKYISYSSKAQNDESHPELRKSREAWLQSSQKSKQNSPAIGSSDINHFTSSHSTHKTDTNGSTTTDKQDFQPKYSTINLPQSKDTVHEKLLADFEQIRTDNQVLSKNAYFAVANLQKCKDDALIFLKENGVSHPQSVTAPSADMPSAVANIAIVVDSLKAFASQSTFEVETFRRWDGSAAKVTELLNSCFIYGPNGQFISADVEALKTRLQTLVDTVSVFGKYLSKADAQTLLAPLIPLARPPAAFAAKSTQTTAASTGQASHAQQLNQYLHQRQQQQQEQQQEEVEDRLSRDSVMGMEALAEQKRASPPHGGLASAAAHKKEQSIEEKSDDDREESTRSAREGKSLFSQGVLGIGTPEAPSKGEHKDELQHLTGGGGGGKSDSKCGDDDVDLSSHFDLREAFADLARPLQTDDIVAALTERIEELQQEATRAESAAAVRQTALREEGMALAKRIQELEKQLDRETHEHAVAVVQVTSLENRLGEAMQREQAILSNFKLLTDGMNDLKEAQRQAQASTATVDLDLAGELATAKAKLATVTVELELAHRRASEAERRAEELLHAEQAAQRRLEMLEIQHDDVTQKLARKREQVVDLREKNAEFEKAAAEAMGELKDAIDFSRRVDEECALLRMQLETTMIRTHSGSEKMIEKLQQAVAEKATRVQEVEAKLVATKREFEVLSNSDTQTQDYVCLLEAQLKELREDMRIRVEESERLRERGDRLDSEKEDLQQRLESLKLECIRLTDMVTDLQGNIRVFCRVRPVSSVEAATLHTTHTAIAAMVKYPEYNQLEFNATPFEFDRVFSPMSTQEDIYAQVEPAVRSVMHGSKLCIFAYGQTGSGKTHTMIGPAGNRGVNMRAFDSLFKIAKTEELDTRTDLSYSMFEVYNERIHDLLHTSSDATGGDRNTTASATGGGGTGGSGAGWVGGAGGGDTAAEGSEPSLDIRLGKHGVYVDNLSEWPVASIEDVATLSAKGNHNRHVASNNVNEHSSRSHLIILVKVKRYNSRTGQTISGTMHLIDLAGSERVKTTSSTGQRLREAQHINKSLSALGDVMGALASSHKHVPYRNSKLTHLLQDSLREHCKVLMFVNINPVPDYASESACSLNFATRCRTIQLGVPKTGSSPGPGASTPTSSASRDRDLMTSPPLVGAAAAAVRSLSASKR